MKRLNKSHTLIVIALVITGCAVDADPALRVQYYYAPMVTQGIQAQQHKPGQTPTSQPRQIIYNTTGRAVGYIK